MTIVCLGDSTTAGTPLFKSPVEAPPDGEGDERSQFAYWLRLARPGWTVLNRGVNGERSDQIAARFERDVAAHNPAIVIVIAGVNDVYQGVPADQVTMQLAGIYRRALDHGIRVVAGSIVPFNTASADQNARMHAINEWIRETGTGDWHVTYVDTRRAAAAPDNIDQLASSTDDLHPDIEGYRRMAEALLPALQSGRLKATGPAGT